MANGFIDLGDVGDDDAEGRYIRGNSRDGAAELPALRFPACLESRRPDRDRTPGSETDEVGLSRRLRSRTATPASSASTTHWQAQR